MTQIDPKLKLYTSVLDGQAFVQDMTKDAVGYLRSFRRRGGCWQGSYTVYGPRSYLEDLFYKSLGYHFEEQIGNLINWDGLVYDLTLNQAGGLSRRRSLDDMYNHVLAHYDNGAGGTGTSSAASSAQSIARYGRREERLDATSFLQAAAEDRRDVFLKRSAWPVSIPSGLASENSLQVGLCGYIFTAQWRFLTVPDGSSDTLSNWIIAAIGTDCEFLSMGRNGANATAVTWNLEEERTWSGIQKLLDLGDSSLNAWRGYVVPGRKFVYEQESVAPVYFFRDGQFYHSAGGLAPVNPWLMRPEVARDQNYKLPINRPDGFLGDERDFVLEEVSAGINSGLSFSVGDEEQDLLAAQQEYEAGLDTDADGGGSGGGRERLNWKRKLGLTPGTPEWERASRASYAEKRRMIDEWKKNRKKRG